MILLVALLVRASLLLALAWLAAFAVRRAGGSAAMRHLVWLAAMGGLLLLPLPALLAPPLGLPILPGEAAAPQALAAPMASAPAIAPIGAADAVDMATFLWALYLAGAACLIGRVLLGHRLLERLWRGASPVPDPAWRAELERLSAVLGLARQVKLRFAPGLATPMTWGVAAPRILVPAEARAWPAELRRTALLHELAHIVRRDAFSRTAAACICALYWFHPAIWPAARRLRLEQEHACDDLVLAQGARPGRYARSLLDVAAGFGPPAAHICVAMARRSELEQRLRAIVGAAARQRSSRGFAAGVGAAALAATLLAASLTPVRASRAALEPPSVGSTRAATSMTPPPPVRDAGLAVGSVPMAAREAAERAEADGKFPAPPTPPAPPIPPTPPGRAIAQAPYPPAPPTPPIPPIPPTPPVAPIAPTPPPTPPVPPVPPVPPTPPSPA